MSENSASPSSMVYLASFDQITFIQDVTFDQRVDELPPQLVISPGCYGFNGKTYELKEEGLYRFVFPYEQNQQRIVYHCNVERLLSSLAWLVAHGTADNVKSMDEKIAKALQHKLSMTCTPISRIVNIILQSLNIESRVVQGFTPFEKNGHTANEIYFDQHQKWVFYDIDFKCYLTRLGQPLSFRELIHLAPSGDYSIHSISNGAKVDISQFVYKGYDCTFLYESTQSDLALKSFYRRMMVMPLIEQQSRFYFCDDKFRHDAESYSKHYIYISKDEFVDKFYSA